MRVASWVLRAQAPLHAAMSQRACTDCEWVLGCMQAAAQNPVDADIRSAVYAASISQGTAAAWMQMQEHYVQVGLRLAQITNLLSLYDSLVQQLSLLSWASVPRRMSPQSTFSDGGGGSRCSWLQPAHELW